MRCPKCGHKDTRVLESRLSHEGRSVRRRRECVACSFRYTTYEKIEEFVFQVRKKDGRIEPYVRDKALRALQVACSKRHISIEQLESLLDNIERSIQESGDRVVESSRLGDMLLDKLHGIDSVAYVRFASVYKDFRDPEEFAKELKALSNPN